MSSTDTDSTANVLVDVAANGIATVTMNRATVHNAFNEHVIADLTAAIRQVGGDESVRVVLLRGAGRSFSAGADLDWMRRISGYGFDQNVEDAMGLATLLRVLDECPKPTVAVVQGPAFGGGVGLISACDIAISVDTAVFALTEVRLGLIPAVISPYVIPAIGERACRRYFLTGGRFNAAEAKSLGLLHEVVAIADLEAKVDETVAELLACGPVGQAAAKELIRAVARRPVSQEVMLDTSHRIARQRASSEGREGVMAFLEKRDPSWRNPG